MGMRTLLAYISLSGFFRQNSRTMPQSFRRRGDPSGTWVYAFSMIMTNLSKFGRDKHVLGIKEKSLCQFQDSNVGNGNRKVAFILVGQDVNFGGIPQRMVDQVHDALVAAKNLVENTVYCLLVGFVFVMLAGGFDTFDQILLALPRLRG